jgi:hypothetical protein
MPIPMIQIKIPSFSSNAVHPSVNLPLVQAHLNLNQAVMGALRKQKRPVV